MVFAHAPMGAVTAKFVYGRKKLSTVDKSFIYLFTIIGSIFPDVDTLILVFNDEINHRTLLTHSLIPYLALGTVAFFILKKELSKTLVVAFTLGVISHLVMDFFVGGVAFLNPISKTQYGIRLNLNATPDTFMETYLASIFSKMELVVIGLFTLTLKIEKNIVYRILPYMFAFSAFIMLVILDIT